jgi:hypothetical protein
MSVDMRMIEDAAMDELADQIKAEYGFTDEQIDSDQFGMFDHVTGQSLTATTRPK